MLRQQEPRSGRRRGLWERRERGAFCALPLPHPEIQGLVYTLEYHRPPLPVEISLADIERAFASSDLDAVHLEVG